MHPELIATLTRCADGAHNGTASFAEIVGMLSAAGVESYHADFRTGGTTYYWPAGETHTLALPIPSVEIANSFDTAAIVRAIRGAQSGEVQYPEFKRLSMNAGCVSYMVWIAGRHVSYFGRCGETHIERFPS